MNLTNRWYRTQQKSLCKHRRQVPKFLKNLYLLLLHLFVRLVDYQPLFEKWVDQTRESGGNRAYLFVRLIRYFSSFIREANFRFFTHWCSFIRSSLFSLFPTGPRSFPWSMFTYNLRELHLTQHWHCWSTSQFVVSAQVTFPRKSSRLITYTLWPVVNQQGTFSSGQNVKPLFLRQYLVFC